MSGATYPEDHWTRAEPTPQLLAQYIRGSEVAYNRATFGVFERLLPPDLRGRRVLDYGGGAGWMAVRCAELGAQVTLVDAATNALRLARMLAETRGVADRLETVRTDQVTAELQRRRFDVVIAKDIVEHIPDDHRFLAELAACQEEGTVLLLSTQNRRSLNYL